MLLIYRQAMTNFAEFYNIILPTLINFQITCIIAISAGKNILFPEEKYKYLSILSSLSEDKIFITSLPNK